MMGWGQWGWLGTGAGSWLPRPLGWVGMEAWTGMDADGSSWGYHLLIAAVTCPL